MDTIKFYIMKKQVLSILLSFIGLFSFAQVLTNEGEVVEDGDVITVHELGEEMQLLVTNDTGANLFVKIIVETITNNSAGNNLQLCFGGLCFGSIEESGEYPTNAPVVIAPGRTNFATDHLRNDYAGDDTSQPVEYGLKLVLLDPDNDLAIIEGSEVSFTFRYTSAMSVGDVALQDNSALKNTIVRDNLYFNASMHSVQVLDLKGSLLMQAEDVSSLSLSHLAQGNYIVIFNNGTSVESKKIIKK